MKREHQNMKKKHTTRKTILDKTGSIYGTLLRIGCLLFPPMFTCGFFIIIIILIIIIIIIIIIHT